MLIIIPAFIDINKTINKICTVAEKRQYTLSISFKLQSDPFSDYQITQGLTTPFLYESIDNGYLSGDIIFIPYAFNLLEQAAKKLNMAVNRQPKMYCHYLDAYHLTKIMFTLQKQKMQTQTNLQSFPSSYHSFGKFMKQYQYYINMIKWRNYHVINVYHTIPFYLDITQILSNYIIQLLNFKLRLTSLKIMSEKNEQYNQQYRQSDRACYEFIRRQKNKAIYFNEQKKNKLQSLFNKLDNCIKGFIQMKISDKESEEKIQLQINKLLQTIDHYQTSFQLICGYKQQLGIQVAKNIASYKEILATFQGLMKQLRKEKELNQQKQIKNPQSRINKRFMLGRDKF